MMRNKRLYVITAAMLCLMVCMIATIVGKKDVVWAAVSDTDDPEAAVWESGEPRIDTASIGDLVSISLRSGVTSSDSDLTIKAYGIDVSKHQGSINWTKVKASGVSFAIIRVGYRGYGGGTIVQDEYAIANIEGALAAGIEVGVYFFSTALNETEAIEEAEFVVDLIEDYDITYPVVYDCEGYENSDYRNYGTSSAVRTANAIAYLNYVEAAGYEGMMYGSSSHLKNDNSWETSTLEKYYDIWVAQYPYYTYISSSNYTLYPSFSSIGSKTTTYTGTYRFWQFSSQGTIDGISGYVDLDIEYVTEDDEEDVSILSGWVTDGDGYIYYYVNNIAQTGLVTINKKKYYFNESGQMQYGWVTINGDKYFFSSLSGEMKTGLIKTGGKRYYLGTDGVMLTGWQTINGYKYYFSKNTGAAFTGLKTIGSKKYYFNTDGKMYMGWKTIDDNQYFFSNVNGAMRTGLIKTGGKRYYLDADGVMLTGWQTINGYKYYFSKSTGAALTGLCKISDKKYYFNSDGKMYMGWKTINGSQYFFSNINGVMRTGLIKTGGKRYYLGTDGKMRKGWQTINGYKYYFSKSTGAAFTGWHTIDGKKYYFYSNGKLKTS